MSVLSHLPFYWMSYYTTQASTIRTLGQLHAAVGSSLSDMVNVVDTHLHTEPYSKEEIAGILGVTVDGMVWYGMLLNKTIRSILYNV